MRVSCIIPVKDRREMVSRAIESVIAQTCPVHEIIVVDDGSMDGTPDVVMSRFPWVRLFATPCVGPGLARNAGAQNASGDLFMFLDSDDVWLKHHVEVLSASIDAGFEVAYGITETRDHISGTGFLIPDDGRGAQGDCFRQLLRWCFMVPSSIAVTEKAFSQTKGFGPDMLGEDWLFFLRLSAAFSFAFVPEVVTERLLHSGSLCCLSNPQAQILKILCDIKVIAESDSRSKPEDVEQIDAMISFTEDRGQEWNTIQDWFMGMKEHDFF